jgi:hypothetical protein
MHAVRAHKHRLLLEAVMNDVLYMQRNGEIESRILYIDANRRSDPRDSENSFFASPLTSRSVTLWV